MKRGIVPLCHFTLQRLSWHWEGRLKTYIQLEMVGLSPTHRVPGLQFMHQSYNHR